MSLSPSFSPNSKHRKVPSRYCVPCPGSVCADGRDQYFPQPRKKKNSSSGRESGPFALRYCPRGGGVRCPFLPWVGVFRGLDPNLLRRKKADGLSSVNLWLPTSRWLQ